MSEISKTQVMAVNSAKIKNLLDNNQVELEKIKLRHQKNKQELNNQNTKEILNLQGQLDQKKVIKSYENQKTLEKIKENLETVKNKTEMEKKNLIENLKAQKSNHIEQFNNQYSARSEQQKMILDDLESSFNVEIQKLDRNLKNKREEVAFNGRTKLRELESSNKGKINFEKDVFKNTKNALDDAHHGELVNQEKKHKNYLEKQEYTFQKRSTQRKNEYDKIVQSIEDDGQSRRMNKQALFEKKYKALNDNHEQVISELSKRKENIINDLKNNILQAHELNYKNTRDPFYTKITIDSQITKLPNRDFEITVNIPESEVAKLKVIAQGKEVKLNYDRSFNNQIENADGTVDKINKVETISKKFEVDEILDSKKVFQKYQNNQLRIYLKRA